MASKLWSENLKSEGDQAKNFWLGVLIKWGIGPPSPKSGGPDPLKLRLCLCLFLRSTERYRPLTVAKLYCMVTRVRRYERYKLWGCADWLCSRLRHYVIIFLKRSAIFWSTCLYVCLFVCLSACPLSYLKNHMCKFRQIFCTCYLWPWLGPPLTAIRYVMYFRFCRRRNIFT